MLKTRKQIIIMLTGAFLFTFSACTALKNTISNGRLLEAETNLSLNASEASALVVAGLNLLEDKRPQTDIYYMTSIREKVSTEILNALKNMWFFKEVHIPASDSDNIVISGEIRKFNWSYYNTMISYIPGLNVLPFFGLPSTRTRGDVEIYLELKNKKTDEVILKLKESFIKNNSFNMYSFNPDKANEELASCFDIVLNKIKDRILLNKNKILEVIKGEVSKAPKPAKEAKPQEEIKPPEPAKLLEETKPPAEIEPQEDFKVITPPEGQSSEAK